MTLDLLEFATLIVTGFTSCAEFGSYAFVHPVIRHLPPEHHVSVERGLLKTFGRVMPVLIAFFKISRCFLRYSISLCCWRISPSKMAELYRKSSFRKCPLRLLRYA
jgi:hypothetical protein